MTPNQITQVQASFQSVVPIRDLVAEMFYERLFELDPSIEKLFARTGMAAQGTKLMASLAFVVGSLRKPEAMLNNVRSLAVRHAAYGVQPQHFATVGKALLDTLERGLGEEWTPHLWAAWAAAYKMLSGVMVEALREHTAKAA